MGSKNDSRHTHTHAHTQMGKCFKTDKLKGKNMIYKRYKNEKNPVVSLIFLKIFSFEIFLVFSHQRFFVCVCVCVSQCWRSSTILLVHFWNKENELINHENKNNGHFWKIIEIYLDSFLRSCFNYPRKRVPCAGLGIPGEAWLVWTWPTPPCEVRRFPWIFETIKC